MEAPPFAAVTPRTGDTDFPIDKPAEHPRLFISPQRSGMDGRMDGWWVNGGTNGWIEGWRVDGGTDGWTDGCMVGRWRDR